MPTALSFSCSAMVWELLTSGGSACHLRSVHPPVLRVVQLSTLAVNESTDSHRSSNILSGLRVSSSYRRPPSPCKVKALTCTGTDSIQQYSDDPRKPQAPVEAIASLAPAATTCGKVGFVRQDLLHGLARIFWTLSCTPVWIPRQTHNFDNWSLQWRRRRYGTHSKTARASSNVIVSFK